MATETRKTGIDVVGEMPWGTHFCLFERVAAVWHEKLARASARGYAGVRVTA